jgi:NitT/TauT family transport system substrate-binding protein
VRSHNGPVRLVAVMGGGALTTFGVREDSGVRTLQELKGKKVSVISFQDTTFYTLLGALATVGLTKNDVDIQALGASGVVQFLISGGVQACACIPEWIVAAQEANVKLTLLPASNYLPAGPGPAVRAGHVEGVGENARRPGCRCEAVYRGGAGA